MDTSLIQPLLKGFNKEFTYQVFTGAEFSDRTSKRSLYLTQVKTVLDTVRAMYEVVRQKELVKLNEESERRLRGHAEQQELRRR